MFGDPVWLVRRNELSFLPSCLLYNSRNFRLLFSQLT